MHAFIALIRKDLVLYFSNRRALLMNILAPIVIAAFFGALFDSGSSKRPTRIPIAIANLDSGVISSSLVAAMRDDPSLDVRLLDEPTAQALVRQGKLRAAVILPKNFGDASAHTLFRPADKPTIDVYFDPSQPLTLGIVRGLLVQHVMESVGRAAGSPRPEVPFSVREQEVTSGTDRRYNSYAHSFAGMGVQFILFMGVELGVGLLLTRRLGLWKRLRAAPLSRSVLLASVIASGALIATILLTIIYAVAIALFGVRIDGSIVGFFGVGATFALLTASFGLLIAALGRTPEAARGLSIFATLIMVMLGGAWVPTFVFPEWLQKVSLFVPTRWAVDGLDAMTWRGQGLDAAIAPIGVMLGFSLLFAALAIWRFDWEK